MELKKINSVLIFIALIIFSNCSNDGPEETNCIKCDLSIKYDSVYFGNKGALLYTEGDVFKLQNNTAIDGTITLRYFYNTKSEWFNDKIILDKNGKVDSVKSSYLNVNYFGDSIYFSLNDISADSVALLTNKRNGDIDTNFFINKKIAISKDVLSFQQQKRIHVLKYFQDYLSANDAVLGKPKANLIHDRYYSVDLLKNYNLSILILQVYTCYLKKMHQNIKYCEN